MNRSSMASLCLWVAFLFGSAVEIPAGGAATMNRDDRQLVRQRLGPVRTGLEVLRVKRFSSLIGKRVGLITNHTGLDRHLRRTVDILANAPGVTLAAVFSPEHGFRGTEEGDIGHSKDRGTGLRVLSLYGSTRRPTDSMLKGIDALVFDIQDVGARFYTYISTMGYCMEAAARKRIPFFVLDRPNPLGGSKVEGPEMDRSLISFTGYHTLPSRHGMTVGELALMFNVEKNLGCELYVVAMSGWTRDQYWEDTGCPWVNTSPNIRSPTQALLYAGLGALECTNVSVGRGTASPFEVVGAPWIDGARLSRELRMRDVPGVRFKATRFTPSTSMYQGKACQGVSIEVVDREQFDSVRCGLEVARALFRVHPGRFDVKSYGGMIGQRWVVDRIRQGGDPLAIQAEWEPSRRSFLRRREPFLLYRSSRAEAGAPAGSSRSPGSIFDHAVKGKGDRGVRRSAAP